MPEHIRALVVILAIAIAVFWIARDAVCEKAMSPSDYRTRRNLWFATTLIAFLSGNFWLCIALNGMLLYWFGSKDRNPLALFALTLLVVPGYVAEIPGFGSINYLFEMKYARLLSLAILLPCAIKLMRRERDRDERSMFPDYFVFGYIALIFVMHLLGDTFTNSLRTAFYGVIDIGLPYYVASRALRKISDYREVFAALVLAVAVDAAIGVFETTRHWLLYSALRDAMDLPATAIRNYLTRGPDRLLRATGSTWQPIILGYLIMVSLPLLAFLGSETKSKFSVWTAAMCLLGGLVAALSRGPWVGAAAALGVVFCFEPRVGKKLGWLVGTAATVMIVVFLSPYGEKIVQYLPFVGSIETGTVDYRTRLWQVSMQVIPTHVWFGDINFMANPTLEQLRQGQGIIDIVNSYLEVLLANGIVGFCLFVAPFLYALRASWKIRRAGILQNDTQLERFGRVLFGIMVGIIITIATVSSIDVIPTIYWLVVGMCAGASRMLAPQAQKVKEKRRHRRNAYSNVGIS